MIHVYNSTAAPLEIEVCALPMAVPPKEWVVIHFPPVTYSGTAYTVPHYQNGMLVLTSTDPIWKTQLSETGGLFLLLGIGICAAAVVVVLGRMF